MWSHSVRECEFLRRFPPAHFPWKIHKTRLHRAGGEERGRGRVFGEHLSVKTHLWRKKVSYAEQVVLV